MNVLWPVTASHIHMTAIRMCHTFLHIITCRNTCSNNTLLLESNLVGRYMYMINMNVIYIYIYLLAMRIYYINPFVGY